MTDSFFNLFGAALAFFYSLVPNYGFIIVALTLVVMIIVTPLTLKATRSMMMMQQLQPEMKKLQSRYKDDRQKLNEELLKFYKENNINPVGGCLPLLIQMPVFFLLYAVLRGLTLRIPVLGSNMGSIIGQQGAGINPLHNPPEVLLYHNFEPKYLPTDSDLYQSLSHTHIMNFFGMDLAQSTTDVYSHQGVMASIPYVILIIIVGATSFIQQRQIQGRNPQAAQINPQQQQIMKIMPIFLPLISFGLPSGLVLYFAVSNLYRVGQQWFIGRTIYGHGKGGPGETGAKGASSSGGPKPGGKSGSAKGEPSTKDTPAKRVAGKPAPKGEVMAKSSGRNGRPNQPAKAKTPAKAPDKTPAKATKEPASKPKATEPPAGNRGRSSDATPTRKPSSSPSSGTAGGAPTLQPRARKNKKR